MFPSTITSYINGLVITTNQIPNQSNKEFVSFEEIKSVKLLKYNIDGESKSVVIKTSERVFVFDVPFIPTSEWGGLPDVETTYSYINGVQYFTADEFFEALLVLFPKRVSDAPENVLFIDMEMRPELEATSLRINNQKSSRGYVTILADADNAASIMIGDSESQTFPLAAEREVTIATNSLDDIYLSGTEGDTAHLLIAQYD